MATVFDIATLTVTAGTSAIESVNVITIEVPGLQGAKGDQNVYPGAAAPANPQLNWIWIKTS